MLRKLFKTILAFSLCFGISVSTNANGVQVSDGSAFITKSEMAYQLNNISERMAKLENSLDSRIDSLVSSYLTRNGIWSGSSQSISSTATNGHSFTSGWGDGNLGTNTASVVHFDECIVDKVSKSGLVFGNFGYGNKHKGLFNNWYYGCYIANKPGWVWDQNATVQIYFYETDQGATTATSGNIKSSVLIGSALGAQNWNGGSYTLLCIALPNWNLIPFTFFTEKGKQIWWRWVDDVSFFSTEGVHSMTDEGCTMQVQLMELSIY